MQRVDRRRSFAPIVTPLEGRVALSGVASAASHAAVLVESAKKPGTALTGSVSGYLYAQVTNIYFVANITSGSFQKYGTVDGNAFFEANNPGTISGSSFVLFHGKGRHNRLELESNQNFAFPSTGETQVQLNFKVQSATGSFASLSHKHVMANLQLDLSTNTITANFP